MGLGHEDGEVSHQGSKAANLEEFETSALLPGAPKALFRLLPALSEASGGVVIMY